MNLHEAQALNSLEEGLSALDITPSDERMHQFSIYLRELKKWNRACSLTGIRDDKDIIIKHFLDSLLYLGPMPNGFVRAADIGSGAGFPGIPIKIVRPEIELYLIESSGKKAYFLRHMVRQMQMKGIGVIEKRIEDTSASGDLGGMVDIALTRALFDIRAFVQKAAHIVRPGGLFILNKGPRVRVELNESQGLGYELLRCPLPLTDIVRFIVTVKAKDDVRG
jgi:16S rRNA (guanine527-N7)-methyltransferase